MYAPTTTGSVAQVLRAWVGEGLVGGRCGTVLRGQLQTSEGFLVS